MARDEHSADAVFDYISGKIKSGQWPPGTEIETEAELSERLGVGRAAARRAVERLEARAVLLRQAGSGHRVEEFARTSLLGLPFYAAAGPEVLVTVLEFRRMFDPYNVELFIEKCDDGEVALLEANYEGMKDARSDKAAFCRYDNEFHEIIARGTRNLIIERIARLFTELFTEQQLLVNGKVGPEHAVYYHGMILDAIKERNSELASIYARMSIERCLLPLLANPDFSPGAHKWE